MKFKFNLFAIIILIVLIACAPKIKGPAGPDKTEKGTELYEQAEKLFKAKAYEDALNLYNEYLFKYPDQSLADESLMKMGKIYDALGRDEARLKAYQRLVTEYPKSRFVPDAMVEILSTYYNKGKFKDVILQAANIFEKTDSKQHIFRTYVYLADTYMAIGASMDAIYFINIAYNKAPSEEKDRICTKLKSAIRQLKTEDILSLLMRMDDKLPRGYLLYQLGLRKFQEDQPKEALKVFSDYIKKYPGHENQKQAEEFISLIKQHLAFHRNDIGCLLPLSGSHAAFGMRALRGIKLALNIYHSLHNETHFNLIIQDSQSDEQNAVKGVQALVKKNVSAIIGPMSACESAAKEAQEKKIPIIVLSQKDGIPGIGDYVFRNFLTPQMQIDTIVPYAIEKLGARSFVVLYPKDTYGETFMKLSQYTVAAYGGQIFDIEAYQPGQTDFGEIIKKLIAHYEEVRNDTLIAEKKTRQRQEGANVEFDAVFIPDTFNTVGLIAPQLIFYNIKDILLMGTNLWHSERLIEMTRNYVQGALVPDAFYSDSNKKQVIKFIGSYENAFQEKPKFIEAIAYDTAMILFQVLDQSEIKSRKEINDLLKNIRNYEGVTGLTSFKANGEVDKKLYLFRIEKDKFVKIKD
jgi:ABC-type branched-subunit amino acid transport system substrate-binding protein/TolA-binding protein